MRNFICLLLLTCVLMQTKIDYYAYYYPEKKLLSCSKDKYNTENVLFNELHDDNGFTCLINLKDGFYSINLNLLMVKGDHNYDLIDMSIGENIIYNNIDLGSENSNNRTIYVKFENGKVNYSLCNDTNCKYIEAKNAILNKDLLQINFSLRKPFLNIILLEKQSKPAKWSASDDCDPDCVHGICSQGNCLCEEGFSEKDCSKELVSKELRVGVIILIVTFVIVFILGILIMSFFYYIYSKLKGSKDLNHNSRDIDIMEKWEANQQ